MTALYPRLAVTGIRKNSKLYFPYIGTCIGMVTMYYIIHSLSFSPTLREMKGGGTMEAILGLGVFVIAIFAVIFLLHPLLCLLKSFSFQILLLFLLQILQTFQIL